MTDRTSVLHISTYESYGGAARSAQRIHRALADSGVDSTMRVLHRATSDESVRSGRGRQTISARIVNKLRRSWRSNRDGGWYTDNPVLHSFGEVSAGLEAELRAAEATVLNLHWVSDMLSIRDIGRLNKPVVWTLHDMWAFCGGEHFTPDDAAARFRLGYRGDNRPLGERGPDLNRRSWEAKLRAWENQRFTIVCPSHWMANCARQSVLFADAQIHVIFYPLDTASVWRPVAPETARVALGLPPERKLILVGAQGGLVDPRKGGDLLRDALGRVVMQASNVALIVYGQSKPGNAQDWPCEVHWLGEVTDDRILALANSAADVVVVPSRQDNLPNTAIEAQACGTPVVAFDVGGLLDIVGHRDTGWLAKPFDTIDLANGIMWVLEDCERWWSLKRAARKRAVERFAPHIIANEYRQLYEQVQTLGALSNK